MSPPRHDHDAGGDPAVLALARGGVVTPTDVIRCRRPRGHRLPGLHWEELTDEKIAAIPVLTRLRDEHARR